MRLTILHFRPTVTQLRIGILVFNLVFSMGVFAYAAYSYYGLTDEKDDVRLVDRGLFTYREGDYRPTARSAELLLSVSDSLQPKEPPPPPEITDTGAETDPDADAGSDVGDTEYEPGPLDEAGWEYGGYLLRIDPLDTLVILRKKVDASRPATIIRGSSRLTTRRPPTTRTSSSSRTSRSPLRSPRTKNRVSFLVRERQFTNAELELDFMVHSADRDQFVYWEPGKEGKFYALQYSHHSEYLESPQEGIRPVPEPEGEGPGEEKEAKRSLFVRVPKEFEDKREKEYGDLLEGAAPGEAFEVIRSGQETSDGGTPVSGQSFTLRQGPSARPGSSPSPGPRPPTAEEKEELKNALKAATPKMSAQQKEEMQKALRGIRK